MSRFFSHKKVQWSSKEWLIPLVFFALVAVLAGYGIYSVDSVTKQEQLRFAKQAIERSVVQCYAIEGRYPPDIGYLQENYGLAVDTDKYVIHYQRTADNLLPDIAVFSKEGE